MNELLTGAHVSIAGGLHKAFERGDALQCRAIQIFLKNSSQWKARQPGEAECALFRAARKKSGVKAVIAHDSYLINLASPNAELYEKSLAAFIDELQRANFLGVRYLVLHPGAHTGAGIPSGIARVAEALNRALREVGPPVRILLENTAGQGTCLGHRFEHLADILARMKDPRRAGVCLDTCHMFAAGYEIRTREGYEKVIREIGRHIGIRKIKAFHLNDSRKDLGSRVDRHCHIGQGFIGLDAFRYLMNDARFSAVPKILETPKGPGIEEDLMNLATLASLVAP